MSLPTTGLHLSNARGARALGGWARDWPALIWESVRNSKDLGTFTLLLFSVAWFGLSGLMLFMTFGSVGPNYFETMWGDVLVNLTAAQIVSYLVVGGILACVVFALSVVSVPMIIDRDVDAGTAMRTSLRVTLGADRPVMLVWGALCVILVGVGFATLLIGMIVIFPLLGHATWYAYLDLVKPTAGQEDAPPA